MSHKHRHNERQHEQQGFTLTEALIAITILAGIAAAMAPALQGAFKTAERVHTRMYDMENHRILQNVFNRTMEGIINIPHSDNNKILQGNTKKLETITFGFNTTAPEKITFRIEKNNEIQSIFMDTQNMKTSTPILLATGKRLQFSYYGTRNNEEASQWYFSWENPRPPKMIRLQGQLINKNNKTSPISLDIALRSDTPLVCQFDAVSRRCREG